MIQSEVELGRRDPITASDDPARDRLGRRDPFSAPVDRAGKKGSDYIIR